MQLKVLLTTPVREGNNVQIAPDLGILYLGTALKNEGYEVTLLDCVKEGMSFRGFKSFLSSKSFDVVGFRCYSRDHNYVKHHLKLVRQVHPRALTLVGGPHPSALPEFVLSSMTDSDFAWKGEAEEGLPALLSLFQQYGRTIPENLLADIPGLVWRSSSAPSPQVNPPTYDTDPDKLGMPAWELMRPDAYPGFIYDEFIPISTTRGCPYPCTYCNTGGLSGKKLRHRSMERVVEELQYLKHKYRIRRFCIIDDEFTLDDHYAADFCESLIRTGMNLHWDCPVGVRLDSLYPELLHVMERAGCESIAVGIESGSERVQKVIKKKVTVEKIKEKAFMIAGCSKIRIIGYFMIGFPDETEPEIMETINLALALPLIRAHFSIVIPIPGTAIFDEAVRAGKLAVDRINWDTCTSDQVMFPREHISGERLIQLNRLAYRKFYGRPAILWQLAKDSLHNRQVIWASIRNVRRLSRRTATDSRRPLYLREAAV